jgi:hypothetical protein
MQKLFSKILLPVAFTRNTRWSVDKTVQLANKFGCDILLLHVKPQPFTIPVLYNLFFRNRNDQPKEKKLSVQLDELEQQCRLKLKVGLKISSVEIFGSWQQIIKDVIIAEHIDLTLIPRSHRRFGSAILRRVNVNSLSQQTNCPIMTITRNLNVNHLQNIVVPVHDSLPVKKLTIATYLSLENSGSIFLMGNEDHSAIKSANGYLVNAYKVLNEFGKVNIQCALRDDEDMAGSTLAFAKDVKANLIVINPGRESRLKGIWNRLSGKYLSDESDIPVMTVAI